MKNYIHDTSSRLGGTSRAVRACLAVVPFRAGRRRDLPALIAVLLFAQTTMANTITVTSTADSGAGTLRAALASAANGDTIDASGLTGTIFLTSGELLVPNSVTILGPGPANLAVDGNAAHLDANAAHRVFNISGTVVSIAGLTITNGKASGGGYPANSGGGIYTGPGTLTLSNCTFSVNSAQLAGGGILGDHSILTVSTCTFSSNSAGGQGGGGIFINAVFGSSTLTVSNCNFGGNSADYGGGGAIYNNGQASGNATAQIVNCNFSGNSASGGGGIMNDGHNSGGATLTLSASTLSSNSAVVGGGPGGGGIYSDGTGGSATLTLSASTLSGNLASGNGGAGGGIYNRGESSGTGAVQIAHSTLSGNLASGNGGGIYNDGTSSGTATLLVRASTFSGNSAGGGNGSGIRNNGGGGSAKVEIGSTILKAGAVGANIANASGTVSSDGYNLASDNGGGFLTGTADQTNTDPMLGPSQDNGGPTFTHALLPGSPAIDQGKKLVGSATDQRGFPRTVDIPSIPNAVGSDGTDIGAVEFQAPLLSNPGVGAGQYGFNLTGEPNQPVEVEASTNLVSWTPLATNTLGASPLHFTDPGSTNSQHRFYRAKLVP